MSLSIILLSFSLTVGLIFAALRIGAALDNVAHAIRGKK